MCKTVGAGYVGTSESVCSSESFGKYNYIEAEVAATAITEPTATLQQRQHTTTTITTTTTTITITSSNIMQSEAPPCTKVPTVDLGELGECQGHTNNLQEGQSSFKVNL